MAKLSRCHVFGQTACKIGAKKLFTRLPRIPQCAHTFHPLTPKNDQHETSPYNILTLSSKHLMRIFKLIR